MKGVPCPNDIGSASHQPPERLPARYYYVENTHPFIGCTVVRILERAFWAADASASTPRNLQPQNLSFGLTDPNPLALNSEDALALLRSPPNKPYSAALPLRSSGTGEPISRGQNFPADERNLDS